MKKAVLVFVLTLPSIFSYSQSGATITSQPQPIAVCAGQTATLSITATGFGTIFYRWQFFDPIKGFGDISTANPNYSGVTTPTLSFNTTGNFGVGTYRCRTTIDFDVLSNSATVTINPLPTAPIVGNVSACVGASITISASGGGPKDQYRWYNVAANGTAIANGATYAISALNADATYHVAIYNGVCESTRTVVVASTKVCVPPVIGTKPLATQIGGKVTLDLVPLIKTAKNNLDLTSLKIITQPSKGVASISSTGILTIDYKGQKFSGKENLTIRACDLDGSCAQQLFSVDVAGEVIVYNAVSPDGNGKNDFFRIKFIETLSPKNQVSIYNRWGDEVFTVVNYDSLNNNFKGFTTSGNKVPSGTYFYKIALLTTGETKTGYLELRY
jgi:gliding motility-associated-like protein